MRRRQKLVAITAALMIAAPSVEAQTLNSPAGGSLPSAVSVVGGIVSDLIGLNGNRVVSQLAASALYEGFAASNPQAIGSQSGFTGAILSALGGGISEAAFRVTLFDGDTSPGDFDDNQNTFQVNGLDFGNFTAVPTTITNNVGTVTGSASGFPDSQLATGFFYSANGSLLTDLFNSIMSTNTLAFSLFDVDPFDNFYDFTLGIDQSLIDVGTGPIVQPPTNTVPEPMSMVLLGSGLVGVIAVRRRRGRNPEAG